MARSSDADDMSLKRLGGGRWQTRDERFTIEPQSGTWVVVDAEQTDDLGLPLVRGPFRSLGDAKEAIVAARSGPAAPSPLAARLERRKAEPATSTPKAGNRGARDADVASPPTPRRGANEPEPVAEPSKQAKTAEPREPRWFAALDPEARRHARRLIARLAAAGAPDAEGMARRDVVGDVPAVAAFAIAQQLDGLGPEADLDAVAALLADGRDDDLGVRWRLVDDDGRPITIEARGGHSGRARRS